MNNSMGSGVNWKGLDKLVAQTKKGYFKSKKGLLHHSP